MSTIVLDGGWWRGKTKAAIGWFPSNHVRTNTLQTVPAHTAQRRSIEPASSLGPLEARAVVTSTADQPKDTVQRRKTESSISPPFIHAKPKRVVLTSLSEKEADAGRDLDP